MTNYPCPKGVRKVSAGTIGRSLWAVAVSCFPSPAWGARDSLRFGSVNPLPFCLFSWGRSLASLAACNGGTVHTALQKIQKGKGFHPCTPRLGCELQAARRSGAAASGPLMFLFGEVFCFAAITGASHSGWRGAGVQRPSGPLFLFQSLTCVNGFKRSRKRCSCFWSRGQRNDRDACRPSESAASGISSTIGSESCETSRTRTIVLCWSMSSTDAWAVSLTPPSSDPLTRVLSRSPQFYRRFASNFDPCDQPGRRPSGCSFGSVELAPLGAFFPNAFMKKATQVKDAGTKPVETVAAAPQDAKRRPLKTFTIGDVHASVWGRDHMVKGQSMRFYSVSFERSYRDATGKTAYSRSMNPDDLGALMSLCQQAGEYVNEAQDLVPATAED